MLVATFLVFGVGILNLCNLASDKFALQVILGVILMVLCKDILKATVLYVFREFKFGHFNDCIYCCHGFWSACQFFVGTVL